MVTLIWADLDYNTHTSDRPLTLVRTDHDHTTTGRLFVTLVIWSGLQQLAKGIA